MLFSKPRPPPQQDFVAGVGVPQTVSSCEDIDMGDDDDSSGLGRMETEPVAAPAAPNQTCPEAPPNTEERSLAEELEAELARFDPLLIFAGIGDCISAKKDEMHPDVFLGA